MVMESVVAWILAFMVAVSPPGRKTFYADGQETQEDALIRYKSIATDIAEVVYHPDTKVLFQGSRGRSRTISVILSVMLHESGFMRHVDYNIGRFARGDQGNSWCLMQLNIGVGRTLRWNTRYDRPPRWGDDPTDIFQGYTGPELIADRKLCVQESLKVLRLSFSACGGLPLDQRLRVYGSGSCEKGSKGSATRMGIAMRWYQNSKNFRQFEDTEVTELVHAYAVAREQERLLEERRLAEEHRKYLENILQAPSSMNPPRHILMAPVK